MLERSCSPRRHDKENTYEIYEDTMEENNDIEEHCLLNDEGPKMQGQPTKGKYGNQIGPCRAL